MKATLLLADSAQAVNGKLYILGGGWSITDATNINMSVAIKIEVPWTGANTPHRFQLALVSEDGQPVEVNNQICEIQGDFEVGRPVGLRPGTPLDVTLAVNIAQLTLSPGNRYVWRCSIDGETDLTWEVGFSTRPTTATS